MKCNDTVIYPLHIANWQPLVLEWWLITQLKILFHVVHEIISNIHCVSMWPDILTALVSLWYHLVMV